MNIFKDISKHRAALMGIAISMLVIYHCWFHGVFNSNILKFPFLMFAGGVDLFLFLSGFGLYYSSLRQEKLTSFYAKRFIRILPTYIIALLTYLLYTKQFDLGAFLLEVTSIQYWWSGGGLYWYISAIMMFYILFPFYMKAFNKNKYLSTIFGSLFGIGITLAIGLTIGPDFRILATTKIPIFLLGVLIASLANKDEVKCTKTPFYILMIVGFVILYVSLFYFSEYLWIGLYFYPFLFILIGYCLACSSLLDFLPKVINRIFVFLGTISLELYLVHYILLLKYRTPFTNWLGVNQYIALFALIAISLGLAYLLHLVSKPIIDRLLKCLKHSLN